MNLIPSIHETKVNQISISHQETKVGQPHSIEINVALYSAGWFDGLMGYSPDLPHFQDYWNGYAIGYREYCCGLLEVEVPQYETPQYITQTIMAV